MPIELPALSELLAPLISLAALGVALGLVALLYWFVRALLNSIAGWGVHIPVIGGSIEAAATSAQHAISNALGNAISRLEARIATNFHNLARFTDRLWDYQVGVAQNLWHAVQAMNRLVTTGDVSHLLHGLDRAIHGAERTITKELTKTVRVTVTKVEALGHDILPRLRAAEHAIDTTIPREFTHLRGTVRAIEDAIKSLWDRIHSLENAVTGTAIAAAVAAVLAAVGLDWLSCRSGASRAGRAGCSLWDDLGKLFSWLVDLYIFTNLCSVMDDLEPVVQSVAQPLITELYVGIEKWPCIVNHEPPVLTVPALQLPALSSYPVVIP